MTSKISSPNNSTNSNSIVPRPFRYEATYVNTVKGNKRSMADILREASEINHVKLWKSRILEKCILYAEETGETKMPYVSDVPLTPAVLQGLKEENIVVVNQTGTFGKYMYEFQWSTTEST